MSINTVNGSPAPADTPAEATATATAIPSGPDPGTQRVGVHPGERAGVPARTRVRVRAKKARQGAAAGLRRSDSHGTPWETAPASLAAVRKRIHDCAKNHNAVPFGPEAYIGWGYGFILPVSAVLYFVLWVAQFPGRTALAVAVIAICHAFHPIGSLPVVGHLPMLGFF